MVRALAARKVIKVGSRGSDLALRQNEEVLSPLRSRYPDVEFQVVTVRTLGDANPDAPLAGMGLGIFVSEIERQLLSGDLDMAVHSLKDMPTQLPGGLALGAVLRRKDPRDVLVNRWNLPLAELPDGARIGTSSPRRQALLKALCPQADVVPIRGNVETRLQKAQGEDYDGVVTAAAALERLGISDQVAEYLTPQRFVPPPGQGVLAVEIRADDDSMQNLVRSVEDTPTRLAITAERAFLEKLGGGCQVPVGAYARADGEVLFITVFISAPDGQKSFRAKIDGLNMDPLQLASDAYLAVIERGGGPLLEIEWSELTE
ncbi:MAG: hydroxymethylbilane synthase [SAR202 cluster bacterium Io17-Chloro-G9]|nr:MAG: hydroxymethylbilane synthase [SAR202 cluster bacterium Io17-Chloro-G9]